MRRWTAVVVVLLGVAGHSRAVCAQEVRGFAGGGMVSDVNNQRFAAVGGGATVDLPTSWFSAGAHGDMFISWPYVSGRGAVFGQVNVISRGPVRPFLLGGYGFGQYPGPLIGGGIDVRLPNRRVGLRVSVEDYLRPVEGVDCSRLGYLQAHCDAALRAGSHNTGHQLAMRMALLF